MESGPVGLVLAGELTAKAGETDRSVQVAVFRRVVAGETGDAAVLGAGAVGCPRGGAGSRRGSSGGQVWH